ncbi:MT-A70 family methyltransferase [Rhizobium sp. CSW-27]|uniref:MT-A70 family methyltransferase n=1 Tax=Rhizobium sp. CSW-27 TaxID=2839985 RepID=UPI001C0102A7|nr:MT-A70 family methyltransferase [Rhizobium sp. CSW-27]MBT9370293.1 ParB N-terminal domain-containing protein [Rhizobium sp. CSW-27]
MTTKTPPAGERARAILDAVRRDGSFTCTKESEVQACRRLNAKGLLNRDPKNGNLFTLSARAKAMNPNGKIASNPPSGARVAVRRLIDSIDIGTRLRPIDPHRVEALKPSILELGLRTPISVFGRPDDARVLLSAGGHRLQVMRELGESWIDCFHEDGDALDAELWEIDENLVRAELTAADRALFIHRRKEIYLLRHPETGQGGDRRSKRQDVVLNDPSRAFSVATAEATGRDRRTIERDASRGAKIAEMALHLIRGTRLDSGAFLDRLKQVSEEHQVLYVKAALDEEKRKAADVKEGRKRLAEVRHAVRLTHMAHVIDNGAATSGQVRQKFPILYADPPWKFRPYSDVTGGDRSAENHYPTMTTDEIVALFDEIGAPAKPDSVLFLWATNPMLPDALRVMAAWGFAYVHHWIWDKAIAGNGYWGRDRHELLLIGKRGRPVAPLMGTQPETVHREAKTDHSVKPAFFADTIDRLFPGIPKLEMFARSGRPGWTSWGHQAPAAPQDHAAESEVA